MGIRVPQLNCMVIQFSPTADLSYAAATRALFSLHKLAVLGTALPQAAAAPALAAVQPQDRQVTFEPPKTQAFEVSDTC